MTVNQSIITYSYHFFSEALITFLAIMPILHVYFHHVPYVSYFFIMAGFTTLFALLTRWTTHYGPYLLVAPVMFLGFYLLNFHWLLSLFLALFFVWRFIKIRSDSDYKREQTYIRLALIFSLTSAFIVGDQKLVGYLFVLFLVLLGGYIVRHLIVIPRNNKQTFNHLFWLYIVLGIVLSTSVIYVAFPAVRLIVSSLWQGTISIIIFIGSKIVQLLITLNLFNISYLNEEIPEQELGNAESFQIEALDVGDPYIFELIVKTILWSIVVAIVGFIVWRAYKLYQRRFTQTDPAKSTIKVTHESLKETKQNRKNIVEQMIGRFRRGPRHPIRKLVYDAERETFGTELARQSHETVEDWFKRLGIDGNLRGYQAVRYGELEVSQTDIVELRAELQKVKSKFKE